MVIHPKMESTRRTRRRRRTSTRSARNRKNLKFIPVGTMHRMMKELTKNQANIARSGAQGMGQLLDSVAESLIKYGARALRDSGHGVTVMPRHLMQGIRGNSDVGSAVDKIVSGSKLKREIFELDSELSAKRQKTRGARRRRSRGSGS